MSLFHHKQKWFQRIKQFSFYSLAGILPLSLSQPAFASDAVTEIVFNLCDYLSGNVAKAIAVLVIIALGYRTLAGRMDWRVAGTIAVGLGLIIGGSYYGSVLLGS